MALFAFLELDHPVLMSFIPQGVGVESGPANAWFQSWGCFVLPLLCVLWGGTEWLLWWHMVCHGL